MTEHDVRHEAAGRPVSPGHGLPELGLRVRDLAIYPAKGEPGERLTEVLVEAEGLAGDRRKKRPVHLVSGAETPDTTRANIFLSPEPPGQDEAAGPGEAGADPLPGLVGSRVRVGEAELVVEELPSGCAGVYASVLTPGRVAVGDRLVTLP